MTKTSLMAQIMCLVPVRRAAPDPDQTKQQRASASGLIAAQ